MFDNTNKESVLKCIYLTLHENLSYVFLFWELHCLSANFHIYVSVSDLYMPRIGLHSCSRIDRPILEIHIYECRNWETEHYNSVLKITVSFLRIHTLKWEP